MRLGIVTPEFPPAIGGVETYAFQFVQALRRLRPAWDIRVYTRPHAEGEISLPGVSILPALHRRLRLDRRLVRSADVDAWHVMNAAYGWIAAEADRVVVSVHGNDFLRPYIPLLKSDIGRFLPSKQSPARLERWERAWARERLQRLLAKSLPLARCVLTNSEYTERVFLERYPQCAGRTIAAKVGVGTEFFSVTGRGRGESDPIRLITVSRLAEPRKNVDLVLRALATLGEFRFVYRVIGEGADRARLETLAAELGIADRVEFLGRQPQMEMAQLVADSDLFVLTSSVLAHSHEGFGIVYLEANACGTPVLAARLGGAVEAVVEGESGMFVDVPEISALGAALRTFFTGQAVFSPEKCRRHARRFSWEQVVETVLDCYESD